MSYETVDYNIVPVTDFQQNCTLLSCPETRETAIVDPGGDLQRILDALDRIQASPRMILLTHGHLDHVGAAAALREHLGLEILGPHEADAFWLDALPQQAEMFGFPPAQAFRPDRWLADGEEISLGHRRLEVLHCPGHTPGHLVLLDRAARLLQVGDVLFHGSIGRTDFPGGNHEALLSSIRDRLFPLGDDVRFIPGHGVMSTLGDERRHNPFLR